MLAFLLKRQNLIFNDNIKSNNFAENKLENLELEIKKKFDRVATFNPEECFDYSDHSEDSRTLTDNANNTTKKLFDRTVVSISTQFKNKFQNEKVYSYKRLSNLADVLSCLLIIAGGIISSFENDLFYSDNLNSRVFGTVIIDNLRHYNGSLENVTLQQILSDLTLNIVLQPHPSIDNLNYQFTNQTNAEIIAYFNQSDGLASKFNYFSNKTNSFMDIKIPMVISDTSNNLRFLLLITTLIAGKIL